MAAQDNHLAELEKQLIHQDLELDQQASSVLREPVASRLPVPAEKTPPRSNLPSWKASPMSPSARARAEVAQITHSSDQATGGDNGRRAARPSSSSSSKKQSAHSQLKTSVDESLPLETQVKMLRSQLRVASAEVGALQAACDEWKGRCEAQDAAHARVAASLKQRQADAAAHKKRAEAHKHSLEKLQTSNKALEAELSALRQELSALRKSSKSADAGSSALQARLQRALEERSVLKEENARLKSSLRQGDESAELKQLRNANRDLQRQKAEVIQGFKQALKLVDVLKRQKVHIEAARLLAFSEDEFARSLESGAALLDAASK